MSKKMSSQIIDITPEDSVVPIFLDPTSSEEMAAREKAHFEAIALEEQKNQKKADAISKLAALGLTIEDLQALGLG